MLKGINVFKVLKHTNEFRQIFSFQAIINDPFSKRFNFNQSLWFIEFILIDVHDEYFLNMLIRLLCEYFLIFSYLIHIYIIYYTFINKYLPLGFIEMWKHLTPINPR